MTQTSRADDWLLIYHSPHHDAPIRDQIYEAIAAWHAHHRSGAWPGAVWIAPAMWDALRAEMASSLLTVPTDAPLPNSFAGAAIQVTPAVANGTILVGNTPLPAPWALEIAS